LFVTDCQNKAKVAKYLGVNVIEGSMELFLMKNGPRKFDIVLGNPPYQEGNKEKSAVSAQLWDKFVDKAFSICKDDGHIALIHPSPWRKPESKMYDEFRNRELKYLEIHNQQDGLKTFNCATRYDWYILQNTKNKDGKVVVKDEDGKSSSIKISEWAFLPNSEYDIFEKILSKDDNKCEVMYSYECDVRKTWMSKEKTDDFKYPCVYMMTKSTPLSLFWSNNNQKGHFKIPKVIVNLQGATLCCLIDDKGEYGMTQWTFGIKIDSKEDGEKIKAALMSDKFNKIWKATQWLSMTREWRIFKSFKKDFWKEFVDENGNEKV
jgi:hypothetical protein